MPINSTQLKGSERLKSPETSQGSDNLFPVFSFEHFDFAYFNSRKCDKNHKSALSDTIVKLSQMTWRQIRQSGRHASGYERIPKEDIKAGLPAFFRPDVTHLDVFRYFGKCPMLGVIRDHLYYVIWLDNEMKLYDHE